MYLQLITIQALELVPKEGVEPSCPRGARDFESRASASSATSACYTFIRVNCKTIGNLSVIRQAGSPPACRMVDTERQAKPQLALLIIPFSLYDCFLSESALISLMEDLKLRIPSPNPLPS